ncbi:nuclear transport factor 2 family protein [Ekhidna sp.]
MKTTFLIVFASLFASAVCSQSKDETEAVKTVITKLVEGVDKQDGKMLADVFHETSGIFAFTPDGTGMLTVTAEQFAGMHASGKFGGRKRKMEIKGLDINDEGLIASAIVHAYDKKVFYDYRLTLFKIDGKWGIVSFGQRSRKNG